MASWTIDYTSLCCFCCHQSSPERMAIAAAATGDLLTPPPPPLRSSLHAATAAGLVHAAGASSSGSYSVFQMRIVPSSEPLEKVSPGLPTHQEREREGRVRQPEQKRQQQGRGDSQGIKGRGPRRSRGIAAPPGANLTLWTGPWCPRRTSSCSPVE